MKALFSFLLLLGATHSAQATQDYDARHVCETMARQGAGHHANLCFSEISGAVFESRAVRICDTMAHQGAYDYANQCLRTIRNRASNLIDSCETMAFYDQYPDAINCLNAMMYSANPVFPEPSYPGSPYPNYPYPDRGAVDHRGRQPSVEGDACWVREQGRWMQGDEFFSYASQHANRLNTCVEARISRVANSGRIYLRDGSRAAKERGGLSHSETDQVMRQYRLWGCLKLTCTEYN
ncbi:MAG: hypothetical protein NDI61_09495 [Bdellovibrionaceae bacterium]|nr:hypothetical protein [Pseudobdellovibrionaceae bacterium]